MVEILYTLTEKGNTKSFREDFFFFLPEELKIINLLKIRPMNVRMLTRRLNKIREDEYHRKVGFNDYFDKKICKSINFVLNRVNILIKLGFIQKRDEKIKIMLIKYKQEEKNGRTNRTK